MAFLFHYFYKKLDIPVMLSYYLRLLFYFHFFVRIKFHLSDFKKKYFDGKGLINNTTTKKFYKNLKSIAVFNFWYQSLHQKRFSNFDLENTFYYALLWTLQDEQTDVVDTNARQRFELMKKVKNDLRTRVENSFVFEALATKLVEVQINSQLQKNLSIEIKQLEEIEKEKGGYSFPFYSCLIDFAPIDNQFQILYDFGVILQHIDDVLDIYEDLKENTSTMANRLEINAFEVFLNNKINDFLHLLKSNKVAKETLIFSLISFGVGWVQIWNLQHIASKKATNSYLMLSRKELVCDMRKFKNLNLHLRLVRQAFKNLEKMKEIKD